MDLEDAEDCRLAAQQLGLPFIKELEVLEPEDGAVWEQEAYPTGCFVDSLEDDGQSLMAEIRKVMCGRDIFMSTYNLIICMLYDNSIDIYISYIISYM